MYAIVNIAGKQIRVEKDQVVKVPYLQQEVGKAVEFDEILLLDDGKKVKIGQPKVKGAKVTAKVVEHGRDKKVLVFKKKRRKDYKVTRGHRQNFTKIQIEKIA